MLFSDDFSNGRSGEWIEALGQNGQWLVTPDGFYQASVTKLDGYPDTPTISYVGNDSWSNYSFSYKTKGIRGVDKQIYFRYRNSSEDYYVLNLINRLGAVLLRRHNGGQDAFLNGASIMLGNDIWYFVRIDALAGSIRIYINNQLVFDVVDSNPTLSGGIAIMAWPGYYNGSGSVTVVQYDNIFVESINEFPPAPTPTPYPTPSGLNVLPIKQGNQPWGDLEYDTAHNWATRAAITIRRWGCALTSAVMVLNYHGVKKMPDGVDLDPATLNSWLLAEKNGFVNGGFVNWWGIRRLTEIANKLWDSPILDFRKYKTFDHNILDSHLADSQPDILGVKNNGHFVVATGKTPGSYSINDPASGLATLEKYSSTASSIAHYYPTQTNLSALYLTTGSNIELFLTGPTDFAAGKNAPGGNVVVPPEGNYGIVEPFIADTENEDANGSGMVELAAPEPPNGQYLLNVWATTNTPYNLGITGYNWQGTPSASMITGIIGPNDPAAVQFSYSQGDSSGVDHAKRVVTYKTFQGDIRLARDLRWILDDKSRDKLLNTAILMERLDSGSKSQGMSGLANAFREHLRSLERLGLANVQIKYLLWEDLQLLGY
jgi:hypothetical protein